MEFIKTLDVPLTHSVSQLLRRYAKAVGKNEKEAAAHALENYLHDMGAFEIRVAEAIAACRESSSGHGSA